MHRIEQTACDLLARGQAFVLATIVHRRGATPRTAGSKMIITCEGRGIGTIGGGLLEADVMARAADLIRNGRSELMHVDLSGDVISTMDMICGGRVDILLACIPPTPLNRDIFGQWHQLLTQNRRGCLVTVALPAGDAVYRTSHCLVTSRGKIQGLFPLGPPALETVLTTARNTTRIRTLLLEQALVTVEPSAKISTAYLFGGGHVARPTAHVANLAGFQVSVLDDREIYANPKRFPEAHQVRVLDGFDQAFADLAVTPESYVIIFTRGHLHDKIVLAQALATNAGYIGMIGSRHKRDAIYKALRAEGIAPSRIERVHCPIGLDIGAESPEEIAVSIVAEMISHRSRRRS